MKVLLADRRQQLRERRRSLLGALVGDRVERRDHRLPLVELPVQLGVVAGVELAGAHQLLGGSHRSHRRDGRRSATVGGVFRPTDMLSLIPGVPQGRPPQAREVDGFFAADSTLRRLHRERLVLFSGVRALLMQACDPLAVVGFQRHSIIFDDPQTAPAAHRRVDVADLFRDRRGGRGGRRDGPGDAPPGEGKDPGRLRPDPEGDAVRRDRPRARALGPRHPRRLRRRLLRAHLRQPPARGARALLERIPPGRRAARPAARLDARHLSAT